MGKKKRHIGAYTPPERITEKKLYDIGFKCVYGGGTGDARVYSLNGFDVAEYEIGRFYAPGHIKLNTLDQLKELIK